MKKEYRKPITKFHELECKEIMTGSGSDSDNNTFDTQNLKMFRFLNDNDYEEEERKGVDQWG